MLGLSKEQVADKIKFIKEYTVAQNAASGSQVDANANVTIKNIATLQAELFKNFTIQVNRGLVCEHVTKLFGPELAAQYLEGLKSHIFYTNDESSLTVYTYSAREAVSVVYKGRPLLISFEALYDYVASEESLLDAKAGVWAKYPKKLFVKDHAGALTKVTRLVKKVRHRDLVRVKTSFGEDIYVTDNHPMIINDRENTVDAANSKHHRQFRETSKSEFRGAFTLDFADTGIACDVTEAACVSATKRQRIDGIPRHIEITEELGYIIGVFIAEGNYVRGVSSRQDLEGICITNNNIDLLNELQTHLYNSLGVISKVIPVKYPPSQQQGRRPGYRLECHNRLVAKLFHDYFGISAYAQNVCIPINVFDYTENFARGLVAGIFDGDGTCHGAAGKRNALLLRCASRYLVSQLIHILPMLGFSASATVNLPNVNSKSYIKTQYPMFGLTFGKRDGCPLRLCKKYQALEVPKKFLKYTQGHWVNIADVRKMTNKYFLAQNEFIYDITTESETFVCNNLWVHNCASISLFPFLVDGMTKLGGESKAPEHLESFVGSFNNLIFAISSQVAGAVAAVEMLSYFAHFARVDYGDTWFETKCDGRLDQYFQSIVYTLNQPATARGFQSAFWNISIFDKNFFDGLFGNFYFPDGSQMVWEDVDKIQRYFVAWFREERKKALLTFPVVTLSALSNPKDGTWADQDYLKFAAEEYAAGSEFFIYTSPSVDSLSSCCRLRNPLQENEFSYSLGAGGIMTGSKNVITLNVNRIIQSGENLLEVLDRVHKFQIAFDSLYKWYADNHMLTIVDAGFVDLSKLYLTIGLNGVLEAAEFLGYEASNNEPYKAWVRELFKSIKDANRVASAKYGVRFNTELVPAENLGVKNAKWDRKAGLKVIRDCYNSYLYKVEDDASTLFDKLELHGGDILDNLDGGSAVHFNNNERLSYEQYRKIFEALVVTGSNYFCENVPKSCCTNEKCGYIHPNRVETCPKCGAPVEYATRVIGYLKKVSSFSADRQAEESKRHYAKGIFDA